MVLLNFVFVFTEHLCDGGDLPLRQAPVQGVHAGCRDDEFVVSCQSLPQLLPGVVPQPTELAVQPATAAEVQETEQAQTQDDLPWIWFVQLVCLFNS